MFLTIISERGRKMRIVAMIIVNAITLSRIAIAISCVAAMHRLDWNVAWWLFLGAILTDILDGYLARLWNVATKAGKYIDSITDVITCWLLVWGLFMTLKSYNMTFVATIPLWLAIAAWIVGLIAITIPSGLKIMNRSSKNYWVRNAHFWYGFIPLTTVALFILFKSEHSKIMVLIIIWALVYEIRRDLNGLWSTNR